MRPLVESELKLAGGILVCRGGRNWQHDGLLGRDRPQPGQGRQDTAVPGASPDAGVPDTIV